MTRISATGSKMIPGTVAVNRGYDTCFWERLVMGYADY